MSGSTTSSSSGILPQDDTHHEDIPLTTSDECDGHSSDPTGIEQLSAPSHRKHYVLVQLIGFCKTFLLIAPFVAAVAAVTSLTIGGNNSSRLHLNVPQHRLEAIHTNATKFAYTHISKCGGSTWVRILQDLSVNFFPNQYSGKEFSVWYIKNQAFPNADYHLVSLRSPRHHVWSLFSECKHDGWGKKMTKLSRFEFPRSGITEYDDEVDFEAWLDHFLPMGPKRRDRYNCFHPANYQSRALTSHQRSPHGVETNDPFEPDVVSASQTYWEMDFVGLVEFTHESRCLLYYRLGNDAPPSSLSYLSDKCKCQGRQKEDEDVHVVHHELGHRSDLRYLPPKILSKVEKLTVSDSAIYNIALREFMAEIAWLESDAALGRRVICDDVLKKLEPELTYLVGLDGQKVNVTQLYMEATT